MAETARHVALRAVEPGDLPAIDRWAGGLGDRISRTRPYAGGADRDDRAAGLWWYVITYDGVGVGTLWIELAPGGAEAVLGVYLGDPEWYGRGLGTAAIRLAVAEFRDAHPAVPIVLRVRRDNVRAAACYRRAGFVMAGDGTKVLPSGEVVAFHRMVLKGRA
jgi:RimJ/RimL family protein N-acetyltransferase